MTNVTSITKPEPVLNESLARAAFERVFAPKIPVFAKNKKGTYTNDRVEGKFQGFYAAIGALEGGVIRFGDLRA
jgi:hypothetical protein